MERRAFLKKAGIGTAAAATALAVNAPSVIASTKIRWQANQPRLTGLVPFLLV